jgi:hypothetical protein
LDLPTSVLEPDPEALTVLEGLVGAALAAVGAVADQAVERQ